MIHNLVLTDSMDVEVWETTGSFMDGNQKRELLFTVEQGLNVKIETCPQAPYPCATIIVENAYFFPDIIGDIWAGRYKDREVEVVLIGKSMAVDGGNEGVVRIVGKHAKISHLANTSQKNRIMSHTIVFEAESNGDDIPLVMYTYKTEGSGE